MINTKTNSILCDTCGCYVNEDSACNYPFCERFDPRSIQREDDEFRLDNYDEIMEELDDYDEEDE